MVNSPDCSYISQQLIIIGYGGHACVLADILRSKEGIKVIGYTDIRPKEKQEFPYLGNDDVIESYAKDEIFLVNGIGSTNLPARREELYTRYSDMGYRFACVIHDKSIVSSGSTLGDGVQIMGGVVINTGVRVEENSLINTSVTIDHDCVIGAHSHIAPGAVLCGGVKIGKNCHIGTGTIIIQGIHIRDGALIGAGSLVTFDIPSGVKAYGSPATVAG